MSMAVGSSSRTLPKQMPKVARQYSTYITLDRRSDGSPADQLSGPRVVAQVHHVMPHVRPVKSKVKIQTQGSCGCFNEVFCGGGCFDQARISKRYPRGIKPQGMLGCCNVNGCCNRQKTFIRRGSSIMSWQMTGLEVQTEGKTVDARHIRQYQRKSKACC